MKEKIASNLKRRIGMNSYKEIILQRCKERNELVVTVDEVKKVVKFFSKIRKK